MNSYYLVMSPFNRTAINVDKLSISATQCGVIVSAVTLTRL